MSVRKKTLLTIGLTSLILLVLLLLLAQIILLRGFDRLQEEAVQQNVQRVRNVIANELDNLNALVSDWAYWDDTYQYAHDNNQLYVESNLQNESFGNLALNLMVFTNVSDQVLFGNLFDLENNQKLPLPTDLETQSALMRPVLDLPDPLSNKTGLILSSEGPLMVAARPILTSQRTGPAQGKLVFGQLLDDAKIAAFAEQTQLTIDIRLLNSTDLPSDFAAARTSLLSSDAPAVIYTMQNQTAEGYGLLNDISGKPILIMEIGMPNSIYQQGQQTVFYFAVALLIAGLTFSIVVMVLLEKIVLSRLGYLNRRVSEIASSNQLSERIAMGGTDELASLTTTINNSLGVMERSQVELQQLNVQLAENVSDLNAIQTQKDRFFANASHNFRTPMAVLRTYMYLMENQPDKWKTHLDVLKGATHQLSDILTDVFDVTNFNRQNVKFDRKPVELKSLLTRVLAKERPRSTEKGLRLSSRLPDADVYIRVDQSYLEQAVENVMGYMLNYCTSNNEIRLTLSAVEDGDKPYADLQISSQGLILEENDLSQIFTPFYKASEGSNRDTGLRLTIAKEIIELHMGEISAEEDSETGISFRIKVPTIRIGEEPVAASVVPNTAT